MKTKRILTVQATPGMIVADDIYTVNNQLIAAKDSVLTNRIITRLKFYSISDIRIVLQDIQLDDDTAPDIKEERKETPILSEDAEMKVSRKKSQRYSEQIRSTLAYKKFNKKFSASVRSLKGALQEFSTSVSKDVDITSILAHTNSVLSESRNGFHVFHMLQCMRDYDDLTYVHSLNVSLICNVLGHWLEFPKEEIDILTLAGLFHDIGKLEMPREIITKPGSLTPEEYEVIKTHTQLGYEILQHKDLDPRIKNAALMHHERCDGLGYPNHLMSAETDDFSKIVAIADTYDAMTSARVYRDPICPFDVIGVLEAEGLQKYDPRYLLPFMQEIVQTYLNCNVRLSNGIEGQVIMTNPQALSRPVVQVKNVFLDLSKMQTITISAII